MSPTLTERFIAQYDGAEDPRIDRLIAAAAVLMELRMPWYRRWWWVVISWMRARFKTEGAGKP